RSRHFPGEFLEEGIELSAERTLHPGEHRVQSREFFNQDFVSGFGSVGIVSQKDSKLVFKVLRGHTEILPKDVAGFGLSARDLDGLVYLFRIDFSIRPSYQHANQNGCFEHQLDLRRLQGLKLPQHDDSIVVVKMTVLQM